MSKPNEESEDNSLGAGPSSPSSPQQRKLTSDVFSDLLRQLRIRDNDRSRSRTPQPPPYRDITAEFIAASESPFPPPHSAPQNGS